MSKRHMLTFSPIPQVDGLSEMSMDNNQVVSTKGVKEPLHKELSILPKETPKKHSTIRYNKNGITCGGHHTLNKYMEWSHRVKASCCLPHLWHTSSCTVEDLRTATKPITPYLQYRIIYSHVLIKIYFFD